MSVYWSEIRSAVHANGGDYREAAALLVGAFAAGDPAFADMYRYAYGTLGCLLSDTVRALVLSGGAGRGDGLYAYTRVGHTTGDLTPSILLGVEVDERVLRRQGLSTRELLDRMCRGDAFVDPGGRVVWALSFVVAPVVLDSDPIEARYEAALEAALRNRRAQPFGPTCLVLGAWARRVSNFRDLYERARRVSGGLVDIGFVLRRVERGDVLCFSELETFRIRSYEEMLALGFDEDGARLRGPSYHRRSAAQRLGNGAALREHGFAFDESGSLVVLGFEFVERVDP